MNQETLQPHLAVRATEALMTGGILGASRRILAKEV